MLKKLSKPIFVLLMTLICSAALIACSKAELKVQFIVNDEISLTIITNGNETINMPTNPTKEGYTFEGWFWDKDSWQRPFTADSLLEEPIKEDISVYAMWAVSFTEGLQFTLQASNTYSITGYTGDVSEVVIPDIYNGISVTGIGAEAFAGNSNINTVVIPSTVTSVESKAFFECNALKTVEIQGSGLYRLGSGAFSYCVNLDNVNLPDSLTNIEDEAFFGCSKLQELHISCQAVNVGNIIVGCNSLQKLTMPGNKTLLSLVGEKAANIPATLKTIEIADGSAILANSAFERVTTVEVIIIPDSVTSIGNSAFSGCSGLTSITIPDRVTSIGNSAFSGCSGLTSITIPDSVTDIGNSAFRGCSGLRSITIPDSVTSIGNSAFIGCNGLTSITIPDSVTNIADSAFESCSGLTNITIPDSVTI